MSRRMIDPQMIIKSKIGDDKFSVNLNEILEKYGTKSEETTTGAVHDKTITLLIYEKFASNNSFLKIYDDEDLKCEVLPNTSFTMTKGDNGEVVIRGLLVDGQSTMNLLPFITIAKEMVWSIELVSYHYFDIHVIKV